MRGVIVLAGPKGAGKTRLADAISSSSTASRLSFGNAVRAIAQSKGLPTDTKVLQDLGQSIVERDPALLCRHVLAQASGQANDLVIDGLRHIQVLEALKKLIAPRPVLVAFIDISPDEQIRRITQRDGLDAAQVQRMNLHAVEAQLPDIKALADLTLDGSEKPEINAARVLEALGRIGGDSV